MMLLVYYMYGVQLKRVEPALRIHCSFMMMCFTRVWYDGRPLGPLSELVGWLGQWWVHWEAQWRVLQTSWLSLERPPLWMPCGAAQLLFRIGFPPPRATTLCGHPPLQGGTGRVCGTQGTGVLLAAACVCLS